LAAVVNIIRENHLDESFQAKLDASVHLAFIECLAEIRRGIRTSAGSEFAMNNLLV